MEKIISKTNSNVKFVSGLNEKKFRQKNNAFYLEGIKVVNELLDKAIDILFIAYSKSILLESNGGEELVNRLEKTNNIKILKFDEKIFKYVTDTVNPQGVLAVLNIPKYNLKEELENIKDSNVLILDKVQDQGNLGTIIRSANAFNCDLIICTTGTADIYSPKTLRSTMGGILNTKVIYVDDVNDLKYLKEKGYKIVTTSLNTNNSSDTLNYVDNKYAFVVGNEANGVSKELENLSDILVKIPMSDKIESLNVGVATSIILYEQYKAKNK